METNLSCPLQEIQSRIKQDCGWNSISCQEPGNSLDGIPFLLGREWEVLLPCGDSQVQIPKDLPIVILTKHKCSE